MNSARSGPPPLPPEVYNYVMKELGPLQKDVFPFWQEVLTLRLDIREAFVRRRLKQYQERYDALATRWVQAREKITVLDKLIDPSDKEAEGKLALVMLHYLEPMRQHEDQLTRTMNDISNTLMRKRIEADYKVTMTLSTVAILIAVVSVTVSTIVH